MSSLLRYLFSFSCLIVGANLAAQCGLTVDAGPDAVFCPGGGVVQLNAGITGANLTAFNWSPTTGLDDPGSLTPRATVSGPATFTLTAAVFDPDDNLIVNGDFSDGDRDFVTEYLLATPPPGPFGLLSDEGLYLISTNSNLTHTNFADCPDRNGPGGQFMVVNGSTEADTRVWCQTVAVVPGATYRFSAWATSVVGNPPTADLQFSINGTLLGSDFNVRPAVCNWNQFAETWAAAGGETSAEICVVNQNTDIGANDFALDDLFFGEVCAQSAEVSVTELNVIAQTDTPVALSCDPAAGGVQLDGTGSSAGPDFTYEWTSGNGNIVSGATTLFPTVDAPGVYVLTVRYDDGLNACTNDNFVLVRASSNAPTATASQRSGAINCRDGMIVLSAEGSSTGAGIEYLWTTDEGNIVSGESSGEATVNEAGTYQLVVTDTNEGCSDQTTILVTADTDPPVPVIATPAPFTCSTGAQRLDASGSGTGSGNFSLIWSTVDGNIVSGASGFDPLIDAPGTYTLILTNEENGCFASRDVTVVDGSPDLIIILADPPPLACGADRLRINATGTTSGPDIRYAWTTNDGNIVANANGQMPLIDEPGNYVLLLTDLASGCTEKDSVTVRSGAGRPNIALQSPRLFTCGRAQMTLNASETSSGADLVYSWSSTGGDIVSGGDGLTPTVSGAGSYTFSVRDTLTDCRRDTTFMIGGDFNAPSADAGGGFTLACGSLNDTLDGSASAQGPNLSYGWTTTDGVIVADSNLLRLVIGATGTYLLRVTNTENGCSDTSSVIVDRDLSAPDFAIAPATELTCETLTAELTSSTTGNASGLLYSWTTVNGNFTAPLNGPSTTVDSAGTYLLTVTDPSGNCSGSQSVTVVQRTGSPAVEAGPAPTLTCNDSTLRLAATDLGPGFRYAWTTVTGSIEDNEERPDPLVTEAGTYVLSVINASTGCTGTDSVEVMDDFTPPVLRLTATGDTIDCINVRHELTGAAPGETDVTYEWSTVSGGTLSGVNRARATATEGGLYQLRLTRNATGCFSERTAMITENRTPPQVLITPAEAISCDFRRRTIVAETVPGYSYEWSTGDGSIDGPGEEPSLTVIGAGTYRLIVADAANGCRDTATTRVQLDTLLPVAVIMPPGRLTCIDTVLTLDGSRSDEGPDYAWTWGTDDGNFAGMVDDLTPEVDRNGTYFVTVSNLTTGCSATDTVVVLSDQSVPPADAGASGQALSCTDTIAILGGAAGAVPGLTYLWTALRGTAPDSPNQPTTSVRTEGVYQLLVTDDLNNCRSVDTTTVVIDQAIPTVSVPPVAPLNCAETERNLTAMPDLPGQLLSYRWISSDGNIIGADDAAEVSVNQPGSYQLFTLDPGNGCTDSVTVVVGTDTLAPQITLSPAPPISCRNPAVGLFADLTDTGTNFTVAWTTANGNFVSGEDTPRPTVDEEGTYVLRVMNDDNNCFTTADVRVVRNDMPPALFAPVPEALNCRELSSQINATNASSGTDFSVIWSTTDGNIVAGATTLAPIVDQPGTYELTVTDQDNDCSSALSVVVTSNLTPPTVNPGPNFNLGCEINPVELNAGAGGTGPFSYEWTTTDGIIVRGQDLARPTVQGTGVYIVEVTDRHNFCTASAEITLVQNLPLGFETEEVAPNCTTPLGSILVTEIAGGTPPFLYSADGGESFSPSALTDSLTSGRYDLVVQDAKGCETSATVVVPDAPILDIFVDPRAVIQTGGSYFINTRSNFADTSLTQISWTPALGLDCADCLRPTAAPTETMTYTISVVSSNGCTATDSLQLVVDDLLRVYFPTGFSPNGDGVNDVFMPMANLSVISNIQNFTVYDRWGEAVHIATDFLPGDSAKGWKGELDGRPLSPAVFVYSATVLFVDGRVVTFRGNVSLVR